MPNVFCRMPRDVHRPQVLLRRQHASLSPVKADSNEGWVGFHFILMNETTHAFACQLYAMEAVEEAIGRFQDNRVQLTQDGPILYAGSLLESGRMVTIGGAARLKQLAVPTQKNYFSDGEATCENNTECILTVTCIKYEQGSLISPMISIPVVLDLKFTDKVNSDAYELQFSFGTVMPSY